MDRKTILLLGVSILILAIMLWFVGIDDVINALNNVDEDYEKSLAILKQKMVSENGVEKSAE